MRFDQRLQLILAVMKPSPAPPGIVALVLATACSITATSDVGQPGASNPPAVANASAQLREFGARYAYDVGYLEQLLDLSADAYETFAVAMAMSEHRQHLPLDAHFVARISALLADDCGACTQLNLRMAVEAGVDRQVLRQLLQDPGSLPPVLRLVHEHAVQVVRGGNADAARVAELRRVLGDAAFAELAVNIIGSRIYPALRRALGAERACPPPNLDF